MQSDERLIEEFLARFGPPVPDEDLVQLAIDFANDGKVSSARLGVSRWVGLLLLAAKEGFVFSAPLKSDAVLSAENWNKLSREEREVFLAGIATVAPTKQAVALKDQLSEDLDAVAGPASGLSNRAVERVTKQAAQMVGKPAYAIRRGEDRATVEINWEYFPLRFTAVIAHGLLLLLDKKKGLGARLKRCKVKDCNRFFLSPPTGGRPRETCEAHLGSGAERTRRWRQQKASVAKHK